MSLRRKNLWKGARAVPRRAWVQCGFAGHFCAANNCRFHLHTRIGRYRVSTVGEYHPFSSGKRSTMGIEDWQFYETAIFEVDGPGTHGEGEVVAWDEQAMVYYETGAEACAGHEYWCKRVAKQSFQARGR